MPVLRTDPVPNEEAVCLALLEDGVAVQFGYLVDLPREGYLVVSLLPEPELFQEALVLVEDRLRRPSLA